jgi:hypothetical protein
MIASSWRGRARREREESEKRARREREESERESERL